MSEKQDFERAWLIKFSTSLDEIAGKKVRKEVMRGSETLSSLSDRRQVIAWSRGAMERLGSLVDEERAREIMTGCACQYPKSSLQGIREKYKATGDVDLAHQMLQEQFVSFLRDTMQLNDEMVQDIVGRGWGSAGVKQGDDTIIATKIPKSGYLVAYMEERDPEKKRQYYCHCPRVRDALKLSESLPPMYCYCGAGFYKGIWEEILQQPVQVEVLESVLAGGEVCRVGIVRDVLRRVGHCPADQRVPREPGVSGRQRVLHTVCEKRNRNKPL
jgi:predicted hydrocarbon binding protein